MTWWEDINVLSKLSYKIYHGQENVKRNFT